MDPLTGMFNRRGFAEACARVIEREANAGRPVTVLIFDIDHFKSINDRFRPSRGRRDPETVLGRGGQATCASATSRAASAARSSRLCCPCPLEEGVLAAERVREAFEASGIVCEEGPVDTTVSIGVAGGPAGTELEVLLAAADTALYQAKRCGPQPRRGGGGIAAVAGKLAAQDRRHRRARRRGQSSRRERDAAVAFHLPCGPVSSPVWTRYVDNNAHAALMSLEAAAVSGRGGFGCLFSTSDEYETALIEQRRAQGRYGRHHGRWPADDVRRLRADGGRHRAAVSTETARKPGCRAPRGAFFFRRGAWARDSHSSGRGPHDHRNRTNRRQARHREGL